MATPEHSEDETHLTPYAEENSKGFNYRDFNNPTFLKAVVFALAVIALSLIFYVFNLHSQLSERDERIEEQQARLAQHSEALIEKESMLNVLRAPELTVVPLSGMEANPQGTGKIFIGEEDQALLHVAELQESSGENEYRIWAISGNRSVPAGGFTVVDPREEFYLLESFSIPEISDVEAYAISIEPVNGGDSPTGEWHLWGNME